MAKCEPRQVKEAVILTDEMKSGPFDPDGFKKKMVEKREWLRSLSQIDIDECFLGHQERLQRINQGIWLLGKVYLESCPTAPEFGSRKGVRAAPVNVTAQVIRSEQYVNDRLWQMKEFVPLFVEDLPLIVTRMNKNPNRFYIDDGANRAVAYYLAGLRDAVAYIGVASEDINHKWKWPPWEMQER
jgi:hypothetical protein